MQCLRWGWRADGLKSRYAIVKVQVSIAGTPSTLVYTEDREYMNQFDYDVGKKILGKSLKGYFRANITPQKLEIIKRVKDRDW